MSTEDKSSSKEKGNYFFTRGLKHFFEGYKKEAKEDFLEAIEYNNKIILAYCYLCTICCEDEDNPSEGIEFCKKGLVFAPENPFLHFCLGGALEASGQLSEALPEYLLYQHSFPHDVEGLFAIGCLYDRMKKYDLAEQYYLDVIKQEPLHHSSYYNLALLYEDMGKEEEALKLLKRVVEIEKEYYPAWIKLGLICSNLGFTNQAIEAYKMATNIMPEMADIHYNLGLSLMNNKDYSSAKKEFLKVLKIKNDDIDSWNNLGVSLLHLEDYTNAEEAFKKALNYNIKNEEAHYQLGRLYIIINDYSKANKELIFLKKIRSSLTQKLKLFINN